MYFRSGGPMRCFFLSPLTKSAEISMDEADLIYPILWTLETLAATLALAHLTQADFREMRAANDNLAAAIRAVDGIKASEADAAFHEVYIRKANNHYLSEMLEDLKIKHRRLEVFYFGGCSCAEDSVKEHRDIVAALIDKDLDKALGLIRANWQTSLERLRGCAPPAEGLVDEN